jgi:hypothetical protein
VPAGAAAIERTEGGRGQRRCVPVVSATGPSASASRDGGDSVADRGTRVVFAVPPYCCGVDRRRGVEDRSVSDDGTPERRAGGRQQHDPGDRPPEELECERRRRQPTERRDRGCPSGSRGVLLLDRRAADAYGCTCLRGDGDDRLPHGSLPLRRPSPECAPSCRRGVTHATPCGECIPQRRRLWVSSHSPASWGGSCRTPGAGEPSVDRS